MAIRKFQRMGGSAGLTIPKGELEDEGIVDENGQIDGDQHACVFQRDDGAWVIRPVDLEDLELEA